MLVAWLGIRAVLRTPTGPLMPAVDPAPPSVAAGAGATGSRPPKTSPTPTPAPSPTSAPTPTPAPTLASAAGSSGEHAYSLTGGHVVLRITSSRCFLVSQTPDAGFTGQNWSSMGWLRVDFNRKGNEASSLVCDWYQQAPTVTIGS